MNAEPTLAEVLRWRRRVGLAGGAVILTLLAGPWFGAPVGVAGELWDLAHVPAGWLLGRCWRGVEPRRSRIAMALLGAGVLGLLEVWQGASGRFPSWTDWAAGTLGLLAGLVTVSGWRAGLAMVGLAGVGVATAVPAWTTAAGQHVSLIALGWAPMGFSRPVAQDGAAVVGWGPEQVNLALTGQRYGGAWWPVRAGLAGAADRLEITVTASPAQISELVLRLEGPEHGRNYLAARHTAGSTSMTFDLTTLAPAVRQDAQRVTLFFPGGQGAVAVRARWGR